MKKFKTIIFFIIICLLITGCDNNNKNANNKTNLSNNDDKQVQEIIETEQESNSDNNNSNDANNTETVTKEPNNNSTSNNTQHHNQNNNSTNVSNNQKEEIKNDNNVEDNTEIKEPSIEGQEPNNSESSKEPEKIVINANKEYYCIDDFILNGTKCTYKLSSPALSKFICNSGTLNGSVCETKVKIPKVNQALNACSRLGLSGSGSCHQVGCNNINGIYSKTDDDNNTLYWCYIWDTSKTDAKTEFYCPSGYTLEGENCTKYYETDAPFNLTCPTGYTLNGINCEK